MSLRESIAKKPWVAAGAAAAVVIVAGVMIFNEVHTAADGQAASKQGYYTTDDGATTFVDDSEQLPPFQHDGQAAVRAVVVDVNGKHQVAYLERYNAERLKLANAAADAAKNNKPYPKPPPEMQRNPRWGVEVKKPGDKDWQPAVSQKGQQIVQLKGPNGPEQTMVYP